MKSIGFAIGFVVGFILFIYGSYFNNHFCSENKLVASETPRVTVLEKTTPTIIEPKKEKQVADSKSRYRFVRVQIMVSVENPDFANNIQKKISDLCDLVKSAPLIKNIEIESIEGSCDKEKFYLFE